MAEFQKVLVDSSSWIEALRVKGDSKVRERVRVLLHEGRAAWCDIVAIELWHGARGQKEKSVIAEFQRTLTCFEINKDIWMEASRLALATRDAGLTVPTADLIIAACAFAYGLEMEHCDKHLTLLEKFRKGKR